MNEWEYKEKGLFFDYKERCFTVREEKICKSILFLGRYRPFETKKQFRWFREDHILVPDKLLDGRYTDIYYDFLEGFDEEPDFATDHSFDDVVEWCQGEFEGLKECVNDHGVYNPTCEMSVNHMVQAANLPARLQMKNDRAAKESDYVKKMREHIRKRLDEIKYTEEELDAIERKFVK